MDFWTFTPFDFNMCNRQTDANEVQCTSQEFEHSNLFDWTTSEERKREQWTLLKL